MNTRTRRRSSRRHSVSTLYNVESRYSKKESSGDVGCALDELRVINGQITKKRRSSVRERSRRDENDILHSTNSSDGPKKEELILHRSSVKMTNTLNQNNVNSFITGSKDIYDSLMDIEQALDEIEIPDQRRQSKRVCVTGKVNSDHFNNAYSRASMRNQRKLESSNEDIGTEPLKKKRRKLSDENSSQYIDNCWKSKENSETLDKQVNTRKTRRKSVSKQNTTLDNDSATQIQNYYLDKTVPNTQTSLETIFEENGSLEKTMGKQKIKRLIPFVEINQRKTIKSSECLKKLSTRKKKSVDVALANLHGGVDID